ncbi:MAG: pseudouridine synthase [Acidimicrobiia bacterium]
MEDSEGERLQKVLARLGLASRRAAEELIVGERVTVNGEVAVLGRRVDAETDRIELDGVPVPTRPDLVYYLLNKPTGVVTTVRDPQARPVVLDLVPASPRVFPVGRLDVDTEGLLLLTNDGELTHLVTHPRHGLSKTYLAEVVGRPGAAALAQLRKGVLLEDGITAPAQARLVDSGPGRAALEIVISEGRNRQVRRMCETVGHPVRRLVRTRIGTLSDIRLQQGSWRSLTAKEVRSLYAGTGAPRVQVPIGGEAGPTGADQADRRRGKAKGTGRTGGRAGRHG